MTNRLLINRENEPQPRSFKFDNTHLVTGYRLGFRAAKQATYIEYPDFYTQTQLNFRIFTLGLIYLFNAFGWMRWMRIINY